MQCWRINLYGLLADSIDCYQNLHLKTKSNTEVTKNDYHYYKLWVVKVSSSWFPTKNEDKKNMFLNALVCAILPLFSSPPFAVFERWVPVLSWQLPSAWRWSGRGRTPRTPSRWRTLTPSRSSRTPGKRWWRRDFSSQLLQDLFLFNIYMLVF